MAHILEGQVLVNGIDIWNEYGVFLTEEKKGGAVTTSMPYLRQARQSHMSEWT